MTAGGVPAAVEAVVRDLDAAGRLPAYVHDLDALRVDAATIRASLPGEVDLLYAVKAAPAAPLLRVLDAVVGGFEVASAGELRHVRTTLPHARISLGGPGKTRADIETAVALGAARVHVECLQDLHLVSEVTTRARATTDVLLRVNVAVGLPRVPLAMGGGPSPFGLDPPALATALDLAAGMPGVRVRGFHAHLASGLDAADQLAVADAVLDTLRSGPARHPAVTVGHDPVEVNLGGGMAVHYGPGAGRFDWTAYGLGLTALGRRYSGLALRIEPGRSVTAYSGWYAARVLDVRTSFGETFVVVDGGTHHLRTPAARGHDQPFAVLPVDPWSSPWARPASTGGPVTVTGRLCTPKDVLATRVASPRLRAGDLVVFALAGAYSWTISHRAFLMHDPPIFHYIGER